MYVTQNINEVAVYRGLCIRVVVRTAGVEAVAGSSSRHKCKQRRAPGSPRCAFHSLFAAELPWVESPRIGWLRPKVRGGKSHAEQNVRGSGGSDREGVSSREAKCAGPSSEAEALPRR